MMQEYNSHYLYPGGIFVSREPFEITTVLGSCVAICIFDKKYNFGGMNHYMLPLWSGSGLASPKYGNIANEKLLQMMISLGSNPENLIAKVFGGAEVLNNSNDMFRIGQRNIELAFTFLKNSGILIKAYSTGGKQGRKIIFNNTNGEVRQKLFIKK